MVASLASLPQTSKVFLQSLILMFCFLEQTATVSRRLSSMELQFPKELQLLSQLMHSITVSSTGRSQTSLILTGKINYLINTV